MPGGWKAKGSPWWGGPCGCGLTSSGKQHIDHWPYGDLSNHSFGEGLKIAGLSELACRLANGILADSTASLSFRSRCKTRRRLFNA